MPTAEQELEAARARISRQRRRLADQDQKIRALEGKLSALGDRRRGNPTTEEAVRKTGDWGDGALPNFVVIGAMKAGTTFFHRLLTQHPSVRPASRKEVQFFDLNFHRGLAWYKSHFSPPAPGEEQASVTGEATPYYLYHPRAAERMVDVVPGARLIVLLRNPVDRAYSHYNHTVRAGWEDLPFEEALEIEELRLRGETEKIGEDARYNGFNHRWFSYLSRGVYVDQILTWIEAFGRYRMLVIKSEEFFADKSAALSLTADFLGLPPHDFEYGRSRKRPRTGGRYEPMEPSTRKRLDDHFRSHNRRLYDHLGVDFGW